MHVRVRAGLRRPHNWVQLVKFCAVGGSGYVVNLCVFARLRRGCSDVHHLVAATAAFVVAVIEQLLVEPALDLQGARRATPASRPRASSPSASAAFLFAAAMLELLVSVAGMPELPAQAISIVAATPLNFIGNKMWSFRIELSRD